MSDRCQRILGIQFYVGSMEGLLRRTFEGGLVVIPSAPVLADLPSNAAHREAVQGSDWAITDSGLLVLLWLVRKGQWLPRISGLKFLRALLEQAEFHHPDATFWVMPSAEDAAANGNWLQSRGISLRPERCYVAPFYSAGRLEDPTLLAQIEAQHPAIVMINLGGGVQERLGYFLRTQLSYRPTIICSGAAIAFLSGRQARIPPWADRLMLGWLLRSLREPRKFIPRYWKALKLVPLVLKAK